MGIEQLLALREQADQSPILHSPFALGIEAQGRQFFFQEGADFDQLLLLELHGRVVLGDDFLDFLDAQRPELAVGALLLAADADEVGVGAAPAFGVADNQPSTALAAVDGALEVVGMLPVALARQVLGSQQLLHPLPGVVIHQPFMLALVQHALVADDADVIGMAQQPVQMRDGQRPTRRLGAGNRRQTPLSQLGQQTADRPVAGRICLKRPTHQRCPLRIDLDGAAFQTVGDLPHVQVADRCLAGRAALLGLLDAALDDLGRQVAAVELGNRGHDAVQQQPRWRLVDVLADRYQFRPGLLERQVDERVISPVTRQAIDLVDDDILDAVVLDELEQPLKLWPVSRLGRLAALHKFFNDHRFESGGLPLTGPELCRERVAIRLIGLGGLALPG